MVPRDKEQELSNGEAGNSNKQEQNMNAKLVKWSLQLLVVAGACLLAGCRMFTIGG